MGAVQSTLALAREGAGKAKFLLSDSDIGCPTSVEHVQLLLHGRALGVSFVYLLNQPNLSHKIVHLKRHAVGDCALCPILFRTCD